MTAYDLAATRASPPLPLFLKEFIHAFVPDILQVLNHTQMVVGSVALIKGFQPATGEVLAFITEPYKSLSNKVAMLFHESTVLAARQATGAVSPLEPFLVKVVLESQVADAQAAIHPARRYQSIFHRSDFA